MTKKLVKKYSVSQEISLEDIDEHDWWIGFNSEMFDKTPTKRVVKTFKVKNYNQTIKNDIIKNMEIEIEWVPTESEDTYWLKLYHSFKES